MCWTHPGFRIIVAENPSMLYIGTELQPKKMVGKDSVMNGAFSCCATGHLTLDGQPRKCDKYLLFELLSRLQRLRTEDVLRTDGPELRWVAAVCTVAS